MLDRVLAAYGRTAAGADLDKSLASLSNMTDPTHCQEMPVTSLWELCKNDRDTADIAARFFAQLAGKGLTSCCASNTTLDLAAAKMVSASAEFNLALEEARSEHSEGGTEITNDEAARLHEILDAARTKLGSNMKTPHRTGLRQA